MTVSINTVLLALLVVPTIILVLGAIQLAMILAIHSAYDWIYEKMCQWRDQEIEDMRDRFEL